MKFIKKQGLLSPMAMGFVILLVFGMGCSTSFDSTGVVISDMNKYIDELHPEDSFAEMKLKLEEEERVKEAWEAHAQLKIRQAVFLAHVEVNLRRAKEGDAGGTDVPADIPTGNE